MIADKFGGNPAAQISKIRRSKSDRIYIVEFSIRRGVITPRITTRKTFHPSLMNSHEAWGNGAWGIAAEKSEPGEQTRKGVTASARASALPPRDVVKYVAIYTGDWRHWRLGSERVRALPFSPFLALYPGLSNSHRTSPPALIVSSSNPCVDKSSLLDQKSIREIPVSIWAMQNQNSRTSLYPLNLSIVLFFSSFFCHPFYR